MIRVALFDLGLTLVDAQNRPFPHVVEALEVIRTFRTTQGKPLALALASDFDMPVPPATPAKINEIFERYLAILDQTGLRSFFEPVERHVTLSAHAGAFKPDRKVFVTALRRLGTKTPLKACVFVTENHGHIAAARTALGMSALQFRGPPGSGFDDWLQAPLMIAHIVDPGGGANAEAALRGHLRLVHGFELGSVDPERLGQATTVHGTLWKPVGATAGDDLANVHAPFTVRGEVRRGPAGEICDVRFSEPAAGEVREAATLVRSLAQHGQLRASPAHPAGATTHNVETDDQGRRKLVRRRFQAF